MRNDRWGRFLFFFWFYSLPHHSISNPSSSFAECMYRLYSTKAIYNATAPQFIQQIRFSGLVVWCLLDKPIRPAYESGAMGWGGRPGFKSQLGQYFFIFLAHNIPLPQHIFSFSNASRNQPSFHTCSRVLVCGSSLANERTWHLRLCFKLIEAHLRSAQMSASMYLGELPL